MDQTRAHTKPHERGKFEVRERSPGQEARPDKLWSNKDQDKLGIKIAGDFSGVIIAGYDLMKIEVQFRNLGPGGAEIVVTEGCARFARF